jgi:gluconolactonase
MPRKLSSDLILMGVQVYFFKMPTSRPAGRAFPMTALAMALAAALPVSAGLAQEAATPAQTLAAPKLNKAQIDALLTTPDKVVFIDVRRADEISEIGSLPVILNIQITELDRFLAYIPRDRQVVTIVDFR